MKNLTKMLFRLLGVEIKKYRPKFLADKVISVKPSIKPQGNALLSYIIEPFLVKDDKFVSNSHTHDWESLQIGRTFLELGYAVDVIDYRNSTFVPKKHYAFFVGARTNFKRIAELLREDCIKIVHLETSHWMFNNSAVYRRCLALKRRRKASLISLNRKLVELNSAIEYADYATIKGNDFTIETYAYAQKPYFRTYNPACLTYPWPDDKDFEACRTRFLWFGSEGLVHKGLDLVLEAFAEMPGYHLTVCGPVEKEKDFEKVYYEELYELPNIHTIGWVDIASRDFIEITRGCLALVYPSCAEGQSGSVVTCLQTGLIPIVSYESGVDVDGFGTVLKECSIKEIKNAIRGMSELSGDELKLRSRRAWEYARANHTRENFAAQYRKIIEKIMANNGDEKEDKD
jgi:glycosyltransferase involved in cell wall biosynthesis